MDTRCRPTLRGTFMAFLTSKKKKAREAACKNVEKILESVCRPNNQELYLDSIFASKLSIKCEDLKITVDGRYTGAYDPCFFDPLPLSQLEKYPLDLDDDDTKITAASMVDNWVEDVTWGKADVDGSNICEYLGQLFAGMRRKVPGEDNKLLRQLSGWYNGDFNYDDDLDAALGWEFNFMKIQDDWPRKTYSGQPHRMIVTATKCLPNDDILRSEVFAVVVIMINQLRKFKDCTNAPVMLFSFMGKLKGRILQAHISEEGIVIRKSELFDFSTWEKAEPNLNIFLQFLGNTPKGGTG